MELFCFASRNIQNIEMGVRCKRWAVATVSGSQMKSRMTKAEKYLFPGNRGLLYCNETHSFTVPFIVESKADLITIVADIWPEPWVLPFWIRPLGDSRKQLPATLAWERWPTLKKRQNRAGGISAAMNITGTTVFVPVKITAADWEIIFHDLAIDLHHQA